MIKKFLDFFARLLERLFRRMFDFLSDLFGMLFQRLFDLLKLLLRPLFIVVALLFYILYKVAELVITLLKVLLAIGKLLFALIKGIFTTIGGFAFNSAPRSDGQWSPIIKNVVDALGPYQLDTLAYVLLFGIWFGTGWAAIRILASMRNGGD